jgi:rhodanese-related sulfurtransferase
MLKYIFDYQTLFSGLENWLILGKGPSAIKYPQFQNQSLSVISLNHAIKLGQAELAHIIDLKVVHDCKQDLIENAKAIIMPWQPHIDCRPTHKTIEDLRHTDSALQELIEKKDVYYYYCSTGNQSIGKEPIIEAFYFSAEAAINLLANLGVKKIKTLGIDGGTSYSPQFDREDLLANGQQKFDPQFKKIAESILKYDLDLKPIYEQTPINVYVGSMPEQELASRVLEFSIKRHTSISTRVTFMHQKKREFPLPKQKKNWPRTPFSFQRFLIPEFNQYSGKAIYLDSDMQVFDDLKKMWDLPFDGAKLLSVEEKQSARRSQFSVMLMNCEQLDWKIEEIVQLLDQQKITYEQLVMEMQLAGKINLTIPNTWNCLEHYFSGTQLLHYTDMDTQPWINIHHPFGHIWVEELIEGLNSGFISMDEVNLAIDQGHIRPSLMYQIQENIFNPSLIYKKAAELDTHFLPPFKSTKLVYNPLRSPMLFTKSYLREIYTKSKLKTVATKIRNRLLTP